MDRSKITRDAWKIARQRQSVYAEPLRVSLARGMSLAWQKARAVESVRASVARSRAQAAELARSMSDGEIHAELRRLDYAPRHRARIEILNTASHMKGA